MSPNKRLLKTVKKKCINAKDGYNIHKWVILRNQEKRSDHTDEKKIEQKKVRLGEIKLH